jgi:small-conductance mechanosensitive channel
MLLDLFERLAGWSARQDWVLWLQVAGILVGALLLALLLHWMVFLILSRLARRSASKIDDSLLRHARTPSRALFCVMAVLLVLPVLGLTANAQEALQRLLSIALTGSVGWLAVRLTGVLRDVVEAKYDLKAATDVRARQTVTRVAILRRSLVALIAIVTLCLILMSIPSIRQVGVTLFASAGIAGLVAGLAARPAISNLIAGIQLAVTEPIRLEDSVIIEGEFGNVEEIRTTYVVVRLWDLRRMIVPLSYFFEKPFQNWTRATTDLLATVMLYVDYTVPVAKVREELQRVVKTTDLWDGKVCKLQVTNCTEKSVELRVLLSALDAGRAWDLRCFVREQLIAYLKGEHAEALPRARAEVSVPEAGGSRQPAGEPTAGDALPA